MKAVRFRAWTVPVAFALVTIISYGLLLPLTGFYWDDWPFAWIARFLGPAAFIRSFQGFRPFLGPIFFLTTSLVPPNPLLWQILALIVRFLAAISASFALRQIWPLHNTQTVLASLLFLVFPGYSQHWVSFTHINQEWLSFICYLLSFGLSARALRGPKHRLRNTLAALALMTVGVFPTEYFIGLEPMRLLFIWVIVSETSEGFIQRLRATLKAWWPYLAIWLINILWLLYFYRSGVYVSYDLTAARAAPAFNQILLIFGDALWKAGLYVWFQVVILLSGSISAPTSLVAVALIAVSFALSSFYLQRLELTPRQGSPPVRSRAATAASPQLGNAHRRFAVPAAAIGLVGLLLGRLPSFAAGLPLTLQSSFDRFMISMMLGASLLVSGLVNLLVRHSRLRIYVFSGLLALGIGQQFFNANIFRRDWLRQQEIYWQFVWRVPALKPQTAIITQQMPLDYETDLSMTAALNWIYSPQPHPTALPYALVYSEKRLGGPALPNLDAGTAMQLPFRTVNFMGSTSQAIVIYVPALGCLRVFDPALGDTEIYSRFPESLTAAIPLSDPGRILTGSDSVPPPNPPFASEPTHTWCYFYEKAELARQVKDWAGVARFGAEAARQDFGPKDAFEWLPFIEADAHLGNLAAARQITRQASSQEPKLQRGLCVLWRRIAAQATTDTQALSGEIIGELGCAP
jgi:hypothetical protein